MLLFPRRLPTVAFFYRRPALLLLLALLLAGLIGFPTLARQTPQELVQRGDRAWAEGSYALALEAYQKALAADPQLPNRAEVELRVAASLFRSEQWDEAVLAFEEYVRKYRDTRFEARALVWRARLYALIPHQGYQVGQKIYRGSNVPKSEGKEAPKAVDLTAEDARKQRESGERAKTLYERFRRMERDPAARFGLLGEEIELNFDLAYLYAQQNDWLLWRERDDLENYDWKIDLSRPFDPTWLAPKKVVYLYDQIAQLDRERAGLGGQPNQNPRHSTVLAGFAKASYLLQIRQMPYWRYDDGFRRRGRPIRPPRPAPRYIPYCEVDPIRLAQELVDTYPDDPEADRIAYTLAVWTEQKGDIQAAVGRYNAFRMKYPNSRWVTDAKAQLDAIFRPSLSLAVPRTTGPGQRAIISLSTRNVKQVRFTAYRIYLEEIYGQVEYLERPDARPRRPAFNDFERHFLNASTAPKYQREKLAEWTATTSDNGKHNWASDTVTTPLDANGAYLIEARAGDRDELGATAVVIVSDLTLVQKVDRDSLLVYAAEAASGKPLPNVKLLAWIPTRVTVDNAIEARYLSGATDSQGMFRAPLPKPVDADPNLSYGGQAIQVFARAESGRYAVTTGNRPYFPSFEGEHAFRAYIYTDRPLYRPKQTVYLRALVTEGITGRYRPAADKEMALIVSGPRGELLKKAVKSGAFGEVNDSFPLPAAADLGDYAITLNTRAGAPYVVSYGQGTFRVEEYKKPEFTVQIAPEKSQVRVGQTIRAVISAKFFFGAPVVGAQVKYRVFRAPYVYPQPFPPQRDWYDENAYPYYAAPSELDARLFGNTNVAYREGELTTDAKGEAIIAFPTDPPKPPRGVRYPPGYKPDQSFTIVAEVVDDSRRMVTGVGAARATGTQFRAFMRLDRSFLTAGDTLKIEVRARDGNDKPVSAKGRVNVYLLIPAVPERKERDPKTGKEIVVQKYAPPREVQIDSLYLETDAAKDGSGLAFWHPDTPADYRLEFRAQDDWGNIITTSSEITVYGPNFDARLSKDDQRLTLQAEFADYAPGQTARLLLVTPSPDSYVLFTEAAVGSILRHRVLFVPGRSTIINAPITRDHVPNALFTVTFLRDAQVPEVQTQVGVPPDGNILSLTIVPDKAVYKPGEMATWKILAKDAAGKPARGAFSLSLVDEALLALQPDRTPDIRRFFYGYRIETSVAGADSIYFQPGMSAFAPPGVSYERHELPMPEGLGWLRDRQGPQPVPPYVACPEFRRRGLDRGRKAEGRDGPEAPFGEMEARNQFDSRSNRFYMDAERDEAAQYANGRLPAPMARKMAPNADKEPENSPGGPPGGPLVEATARRLFADTAFWTPQVVADGDGVATVTFVFPDNITTWKATARGLTGDVKVGVAETQATVKKNLMARLQAPRFFVERDQVMLSANIHNYLPREKRVRVELVTDDRLDLTPSTPLPYKPAAREGRGESNAKTSPFPSEERAGREGGQGVRSSVREIVLKPDAEMRLDWTVSVKKPGPTKIKVVAQTDEESDAAELEFPVLVHGVEKFLAQGGVLRNGGTATLTVDLPELRQMGATLLDVQLQPSLAATLLDALPYLEEFPYGCVEQTLSRFVPTALVAKTLRDAGIDLETLGRRAKALEEQRKSLPPQQQYENSGYTYPKGVPGTLDARELASRLDYHNRSRAPIFDSAALKAMVDAGLQRLAEMQRGDGGWGWWLGSPNADPYLTALVLDGLQQALAADLPVNPMMLDRGLNYLLTRLDGTEDLHLLAYYVYVLTPRYAADIKALPPDVQPPMPNAQLAPAARLRAKARFLHERRDRINAYGKALLAIALQRGGDTERAGILVRNLVNTAKLDTERGTAYWESSDRAYWRWYNDKQETTAMVLRALLAVDSGQGSVVSEKETLSPGSLAAMTVRWLVDNRRGGYWTSTRQTAQVVQALIAYAKAQKELTPDYTVTVDVDGKVQKQYKITAENALFFDNRFLVGDEILTTGGNRLTIRMEGTGTLYWSSYLKYFDRQEPIKGVANAIGVERKYYKVVPKKKRERGQIVTTYDRVPLPDGATLASGDIIEVELYLKSDNDYDYLVFEDMKPAGCEPVETRSGTAYGDGLCSNFELRDEKVAFFIDRLPQGTRRIAYRLRAEIPGAFHALPTNGYAFYTPDIRALSDEWRVTILDAK